MSTRMNICCPHCDKPIILSICKPDPGDKQNKIPLFQPFNHLLKYNPELTILGLPNICTTKPLKINVMVKHNGFWVTDGNGHHRTA